VTGFTALLQRLNQTEKLSLLLSHLRNAALQTMDFSLQGFGIPVDVTGASRSFNAISRFHFIISNRWIKKHATSKKGIYS
jgi:NAD(P)H-dependent flavin oxidoreductase YrpB (nitropropane dioxygenase family)